MLMFLCACGTDVVDGTYFTDADNRNLTVILDNGYCLIDVADEHDGKTAYAVIGGEYTYENGRVIIESSDESFEGERFEFLYSKSGEDLTNTSDGTVYRKIDSDDVNPDGVYEYADGTENYVLTIDGDSCELKAYSVNKNGESANAEEHGKVSVSGNTVEIKMDNKNYRFIYADGANVLMDTSDGRMYKETTGDDE